MAEASKDRQHTVEAMMNDTIHEFFRKNENAMVVKWMTQVEIIDSDGEPSMWTLESPGMSVWDMLGILEYMKIDIAGKIEVVHRMERDEDEDD